MKEFSFIVDINVNDKFDELPKGMEKRLQKMVRNLITNAIENEDPEIMFYPDTEFYFGRISVTPFF